MGDRIWLLAAMAMLLLTGCTVNHVTNVYAGNPPTAANVQQRASTLAGAIVLYRIQGMRIAEEATLIKTSGAPQPLPTGQCSASVPVDAIGMIDGASEISCDNPALADDVRQAIQATAPYLIPPAQNALHFHLIMNRAEPGVAPI